MTATNHRSPLDELLAQRVIEPVDFVADTEAFVDVRIERSKGKASYSFIGPGVSQNADQLVNLVEPHGFQVGAASMPSGLVNNPHLHFTAEVFVCTRGSFRVTIGEDSGQSVDIGPGDIFSVPTWIFRGFINTGDDDSWLFAVLGGDDTGGILWAPHVLTEAAATGLYLDQSYAVLDATAGDDVSGAIAPLTAKQLEAVDSYSDDDLASRAVRSSDLAWSDRALLSSAIDGHRCRLAPVVGYGLTEDRSQHAPIGNPHGFSIEWLEIDPGSSTGRHRHDAAQVVLLVDGDIQIEIVDGDRATASRTPAAGSVVSVPAGTWRTLTNVGGEPARVVVVCGGDAPTRIEWDHSIVEAARAAGTARDAAGYLAPAGLVGPDEGPQSGPSQDHQSPTNQPSGEEPR